MLTVADCHEEDETGDEADIYCHDDCTRCLFASVFDFFGHTGGRVIAAGAQMSAVRKGKEMRESKKVSWGEDVRRVGLSTHHMPYAA
jgi:hypothetical protein